MAGPYTYTAKIGEVIHPHGSKSTGNYIFGVNDSSQVANQKLLEDFRVSIDLIKHHGNFSCKVYQEERSINIINESDIIIIYGMSLGSSDKQWWLMIGNWLASNTNNILVIQSHKEISPQSPIWQQLDCTKGILTRFFDYTDIEDEIIETIAERVLVGFKPKLFIFDQFKEKYLDNSKEQRNTAAYCVICIFFPAWTFS